MDNNGIYFVGSSDKLPEPLSKEEETEYVLKNMEGDIEAKNKLIEHNLRLVVFLAKKYENTSVDLEDLVSIGTIGLIKGISTYKLDKNIKLATYASRCIDNEILMFLRKNKRRKTEISFEDSLSYDGEGNEYATFDVYVDYVSDDTIQFRTNNGGSELIEVIKKNSDNLTRNLFRGEVYYRENLTSKEDVDKDIILKDPVKKGTTWALPEGGNRTITDVEVSVSTPIGNYDTIEVTTSGNDGETKEYYAKDLGLVKREFIQEGFRITSTLSNVDKDVSHVQTVRFYMTTNKFHLKPMI